MMFIVIISIWLFFNKVEVFKQYGHCVKIKENVAFFKTVIQKFLELKVRTMVIVYEKHPEFWYGS